MLNNDFSSSVFDDIEKEKPFFEYATIGQRFLNGLIDMVIFFLFYIIVITLIEILFKIAGKNTEAVNDLLSDWYFFYSLLFLIYVFYYTVLEGFTKGLTVGKTITKTICVKTDLSPIGWYEAFQRSVLRIIPMEAFTALGGFPWHDKWSKTMVIKIRE